MLENQDAFAAAEAVICVVDEDRRHGPGTDTRGAYNTLEGAVAGVLSEHLDMPFEHVLRRAISQARDEETGMRLGYIDPRDLADYDPEKPETADNLPPTKAEKLQRLLTDALEELATVREHRCSFDSQDYCTICGLDGRA